MRAGASRPASVSAPVASIGMAEPGRPDILLVEDETAITEPLAEALEREGFSARVAGTVADALAHGRPRSLPTWSCSTSGCPTGRDSTSAARCASRATCR